MCTSWSADGKRAVLLVNYSETPELCCVTLPAAMSWTLVKPDGTESHLPSEARLDVPPLNALLIEAD